MGITELLRDSLKFDGVVCTDWNIINPMPMADIAGRERAWGVENLTPEQRLKKSRIDQSVRRILRDKFTIGLFDNPFVDVNIISEKLSKQDEINKGEIAQVKSTVLLKNQNKVLPFKKNIKLYLSGFRYQNQFSKYAEVVENPEVADYII